MAYLRKYSKLILLIALVLLIGITTYYFFVPEFKKSKNIDEVYVYIKDGNSQKKYKVKYNEEFNVNIKNDKFYILLPYNHTVSYDWQVNPTTSNTVLHNSFIKESRIPIYDWNKEGIDYSMKVFEFKHEKATSEKLVFKYIHTKGRALDKINEIIINVK